MKSINGFLKNIKNVIPYLILIAIYFFFVNLEAKKEDNLNTSSKNIMPKDKLKYNDKNLRIKIPVIPYNE